MVETACALPHATNVDVLNCLRRVKQLVLLSHDQLKRKQAEIMQKAKEKEILKQKLKHSQRAKKQVNAAKNNGNKGAASPTKTGKKNKSNNKPHKKLQHQHHHRYHPKHRASYDNLLHYLSTLDHSLTAVQCSQVVRLFTSKSLSSLIEEWVKSPEVVAAVVVKLFGLVRDRANLWMTLNGLTDQVQRILRHKLGSLRLFNPSHPQNVYNLDMADDEDRRLARVILSLSEVALQSKTNIAKSKKDESKSFFSNEGKGKKETEEGEDVEDVEQTELLLGNVRWSVVATETVESRIELIEPAVVVNEGESVEISESKTKDKSNDKKKKKKKKKREIKEEIQLPPPTRTVVEITPIVIQDSVLPPEGMLRITIVMNRSFVGEDLESTSSSGSSSSGSDSDSDSDSGHGATKKEQKEKEKRKKTEGGKDDGEEKQQIKPASNPPALLSKRMQLQQQLETTALMMKEKETFKWTDVRWMNVANTCWMGVGRKEPVQVAESKKSASKKNKRK
tara:strand:- start:24 stop:1541 length:1518 start_codon:yes stop_codon:yes gene_type:complete